MTTLLLHSTDPLPQIAVPEWVIFFDRSGDRSVQPSEPMAGGVLVFR